MSAEAILKELGELRDYAEGLEQRIADQRVQIKALTELRNTMGDRKARKRITYLERMVGCREVRIEQQKDTIRWFVGKYGENPARNGTATEHAATDDERVAPTTERSDSQ